MNNIPFLKFIITLLFFGHDSQFIHNKLKSFGYSIDIEKISNIFIDIKRMMPENIRRIVEDKQPLDINNEKHAGWIRYFKVYELYHYISEMSTSQSPPPYFKWFDDCLWIHNHRDAMCLTNIFIFNKEPLESISAVLYFRYRKQITANALQKYCDYFWDTECLTAPDAFAFCKPFQENASIVRKLRTGNMAISTDIDRDEGIDLPVLLQDSEYIKWKIGYKDVKVPGAKEFLQSVQRDSYFKFYETMQMTQSAELDEETEDSDEFGNKVISRKRYRNVEESRAKLARQWLDMYVKASENMPGDDKKKDEFFENMNRLELGFYEDDKIVDIKEHPEMLEDISQDIR